MLEANYGHEGMHILYQQYDQSELLIQGMVCLWIYGAGTKF